MNSLFAEILRYLTFLYLILLITYSRQNVNIFYANDIIARNTLIVEELKTVQDLKAVWHYLGEVLVNRMYDEEDPMFVHNIPALRLLAPILVQQRKTSKPYTHMLV